MKPPNNPLGYTTAELAVISGRSIHEVECACDIVLHGCNVSVNETGDDLIYPPEAHRVLSLLESEATRYTVMDLHPRRLSSLAHAQHPHTQALALCYKHGLDAPKGDRIIHVRGDEARHLCEQIAETIGKPVHYVVFKCFANQWQAFIGWDGSNDDV